MKLLVINQSGNGVIVTAQSVPRIGEQVDMFYKPNPFRRMIK